MGQQIHQPQPPQEPAPKLMFFAAVLIIAALTFAGLRIYEQDQQISLLELDVSRLSDQTAQQPAALKKQKPPPKSPPDTKEVTALQKRVRELEDQLKALPEPTVSREATLEELIQLQRNEIQALEQMLDRAKKPEHSPVAAPN